MLMSLSGREHIVSTGVCITDGERKITFENTTLVEFYPLTEEIVNSYLDTSEYCDKAGSYGIQGKGAVFVDHIDGDYANVVGLPVSLLYEMLREFDIDIL